MSVQHSSGGAALSRRRVLQAGLTGAAGLAWANTGVAAAAAPDRATLSVGDRAFLDQGLQHLAWITTPNATNPTGVALPCPSTGQFNGSGFTGPCYYTAGPDGMYNTAYQRRLDSGLWATAQFPTARQQEGQPPTSGHIVGPPEPGQRFLSPAMAKDVDNMFAACFGDEEVYSADLVDWLAQYYAMMREQAPGVLVYNNQYSNQWSDEQLRSYVRTAKPDLINWDAYYFSPDQPWPTGSVTPLYNDLERYRRLALEGTDGAGRRPINFGLYTQAYNGGPWPPARPYVLSESQVGVVAYAAWAMGAKLLNLFRWTWMEPYPGYFLLNFSNGDPTPVYHEYAALNREMTALSPYLTRLRTNTVSILRGMCEPADPQPTPKSHVADWTPAIDDAAGITALSQTNVGGANGGLPGDTLVGTFRGLPGMSHPQSRGLIDQRTKAFLLVNTLAVPNTDPTDWSGTGGTGEQTRQRLDVTVRVVGSAQRPRSRLLRIDRPSGRRVHVDLRQTGPDTFSFSHQIDGGRGDLFIWE